MATHCRAKKNGYMYCCRYLSLVKPSDGEEYSPKLFGSRIESFKLVIVTQLLSLSDEIVNQCYVIRIHTPQNLDY